MRVLLTGGSGFVGSAVLAELLARRHEVLVVVRLPPAGGGTRAARWLAADLARPGAAEHLVRAEAPQAVVHLAALADIATCQQDPALAQRLNAELPGELAAACAARGARLLHVSTDQVFDGSRGGWREEDEPRPLHVYGHSKLEGEHAVLAARGAALVVRPGLVTGRAPAGRRSASSTLLDALARGERPRLFTDELRTPVASVDVGRALVDLLERDELWAPSPSPAAPGRLLHLGGPEVLSRFALGRREAEAASIDADRCVAGTRAEAGLERTRPADLSLDSRRMLALLGWEPRSLVGS